MRGGGGCFWGIENLKKCKKPIFYFYWFKKNLIRGWWFEGGGVFFVSKNKKNV